MSCPIFHLHAIGSRFLLSQPLACITCSAEPLLAGFSSTAPITRATSINLICNLGKHLKQLTVCDGINTLNVGINNDQRIPRLSIHIQQASTLLPIGHNALVTTITTEGSINIAHHSKPLVTNQLLSNHTSPTSYNILIGSCHQLHRSAQYLRRRG